LEIIAAGVRYGAGATLLCAQDNQHSEKLPKSQQSKTRATSHEAWMATTRQDAKKSFDHFLTVYRPKHPITAECLEKDREALLTLHNSRLYLSA
jgi:hypothetical protein